MEMLNKSGVQKLHSQKQVNIKFTLPKLRSLQSDWLWSIQVTSLEDAEASGISSESVAGSSETYRHTLQ